MDNTNAPGWVLSGLCAQVEPDLWFSDNRSDKRKAKAICAGCPFVIECREYGKDQEYGIWGGVEADPSILRRNEKAAKYEAVLAEWGTGKHTKAEIARLLGIPRPTVHFIIDNAA